MSYFLTDEEMPPADVDKTPARSIRSTTQTRQHHAQKAIDPEHLASPLNTGEP